MNILIIIAITALCYFLVYGICRLLSGILVAIKLPWAALIAGCVAIIVYLRHCSFLNYIVVAISLALLARLLIKQVVNMLDGTSDIKNEYHETLSEAYAALFSFLVFGTLYANLNYILAVPIAGMSMDEYKEMGIFAGAAFSALGIGPVKWFVLALAVIAVFQVAVKTEELRTLCRIKAKEKERANNHKSKVEGQHSNVVPTAAPAPALPTENSVVENQENKIGSYYSSAMGIPVFPTENTVEANHRALKEYFLPLLQN